MAAPLKLAAAIDSLNRHAAVVANWLVLGAALVCAFDAFLRYTLTSLLATAAYLGPKGQIFVQIFDFYRNNSNALRDLQLVMFAGMVLLGASWTLKLNEHVRVDLLYARWSDKGRDWIDLLGALLFLIPFCLILIRFSWPWFLEAWSGDELSQNAGGLPRWPIKGLVPLGMSLLLLQAVSEIIKCVASIFWNIRREHAYEKPVQ
ncbi:MAG: TRAP transporter small permease subunit [Alphaproteobacteria bacterium]|nr:TRAP transporter small permease subunit [Alphaproteobacteria bacterium]